MLMAKLLYFIKTILLCLAQFTVKADEDVLSLPSEADVTTLRFGEKGPCSPLLSAVQIPVSSVNDIFLRLSHSNTQTTILLLQNDIHLTSTLHLNASFSCTILTSKVAPEGKGSYTFWFDAHPIVPMLIVLNVSNLLILKVNFHFPITSASPFCTKYVVPEPGGSNMLCPALYFHSCWGLQLVKGHIHGRVEVWRTADALFDSLNATAPGQFAQSPGVLRLAQCGDAKHLKKSNIVISNNHFFGLDKSETGINLSFHTLGVTAVSNSLVNFSAMAFNFIFDCFLTNFSRNYVEASKVFYSDGAGIYYNTKYYSPGNYVSCNYVIGGQHCLYFDWASSDTAVEGGVCLNNLAGAKVNTGKNVSIHSVVFHGVPQEGWLSCQDFSVNNCGSELGQWWEEERKKNYHSQEWQEQYPKFDELCNKVELDGVSCNPPGEPPPAVTGNCSGLPYSNDVQLLLIEHKSKNGLPGFKNCVSTPNIVKFNSIGWENYSITDAKFNNVDSGDYGVHNLASAIIRKNPDFKSCPLSEVGPKEVEDSTYFLRFNSHKPSWFDEGLLGAQNLNKELIDEEWNNPTAWFSKSMQESVL